MKIDTLVLGSLESRAASGGALIQRYQVEGESLLRGRAVLVYGALASLHRSGRASPVASGPGERVWGLPGTPPPVPRAPGLPPSFGLNEEALGRVDGAVGRLTAGLPQHYFEELRRSVVADADRRVSRGASQSAAIRGALDDLGPPGPARRFLRRVERGRPAPLRLGASRRWILIPAVLIAVLALIRLFVLGLYTVPPASVSMAPHLMPAAEGGDALVLANLLVYRTGPPERGDIAVFRPSPSSEAFVKRVMGLPGERVGIRRGDLFLDGARLVKERELLDRLKVPLYSRADLLATEDPPGWRLPDRAHAGFRRPDGSLERREGICRDVVVEMRLRPSALPCTVTVLLEEQGRPAHTLLLSGSAPLGGVSVAGLEVARGLEFALEAGRAVDLWITNADACLRVELDGGEVARAMVPRPGGSTSVTVVLDGEEVAIERVEIARDLLYDPPEGEPGREWRLSAGEVFLLGDNSSDSRDSRQMGPIALDRLIGRVMCVAWPPGRIRLVR